MARLSEIALSITDGDHQPPPKASAGVPFLTIAAINNGRLQIDRATRYVPETYFAALRPDRKPAIGDVLFSVTGSIAIPAIVDDPRPFTFQRHIAIIRPDPNVVDTRYLWHALQTSEIEEQAHSVATGTAQLTIPLGGLRNLLVPLPPLPEQRRIVARIDSLSAKSSRARAHLDHIPRLVEKYKQAILAAAFSWAGKDHAPITLGEVMVSTFYGPRFAKEAYSDHGVITLRTTDFDDDGNIHPRSPPVVRVSVAEFAKWGLIDGDVLVTRTGSIGKCALYEEAIGPALPSAYLIRVRLQRDRIRPRYVLLFLLSELGQRQLTSGITAVTQPNINARVIERLRLPVPTLDRQDDAIRRIETAFTWIDRLAADATSARKLIAHLDQAILAKAFRGELVPQSPTDEPASALLERIRAERQSTTARPRRAGRRS